MKAHKIIFSGPVGAGKSTAIATVSDIKPFVTEEIATDETRQRKDSTTVAMDYGMIKLDSRDVIHLYGTPGQDRFDFMWEILSDGGIGLIILIDNLRTDPIADLQCFLSSFEGFIRKTSAVIGVTRMDLGGGYQLADYRKWMEDNDYHFPLFEVDARSRSDISYLIQTLLYCIDPYLHEAS